MKTEKNKPKRSKKPSQNSRTAGRHPAHRGVQHDHTAGILWMISSCFWVSVMVSIVRYLSSDMHTLQIAFMRNVFACILLVPMVIQTGLSIFRTNKLGLHITRGINGFAGVALWFYSLSLISLPEAVSISFIVPITTTIAAIIFLKEKTSLQNWIAIFTGFLGVLFIIRPGFRELNPAHLLTIIVTISWALSNIMVKRLTATEDHKTIVIYLAATMLICSIPPAIPFLEAMTPTQIFWLFLLGVSSNLAHLSMALSYSKSDLSHLQPFDFSRLVFTSTIAYIAFDETIDVWTITGALIIISSSFYIARRHRNILSQNQRLH